MQVNPVHALIGLLRNEAQRGVLGRDQKLQLNALADILNEAKDAKDRLGKLEEAIAKGELKAPSAEKAGVKRPGWPDFEHEAGIDKSAHDFTVRVGMRTSDAMTQALKQSHGRTWGSYPSNDNATHGATGSDYDQTQDTRSPRQPDPHADVPPGFAFPFKPTVEDVETALRTGKGWPAEIGEEVRLRILRDAQKQEQADAATAYPFWPYVIVIMAVAALVLYII